MILILISLLFPLIFGKSANPIIRVKTTEGTVVGAKASNENYLEFYGIPYAGSVSGDHRFKAAPPPPKFQEEFIAVNRTVVCAQPDTYSMIGVEDCLTLNVFTKNVSNSNPIFAFLNGKEFSNTYKSSPYTFKSLLENNVIVVELNYRLSIFGFLCLGVAEAPGNAGLKDVIQALKWIKDNAAGFGGDPNKIILLGYGSGAAMVDLVTISPLSKNLVHKAIALSGSAIAPGAVAFEPARYAKALGAMVGFTGKNHKELAQHLVKTDKDKLASASKEMQFSSNTILFAPCVENKELPDSFLNEAPIKLLQSGKYHPISYIAGFEDKKGITRDWAELLQKNYPFLLPENIEIKNGKTKKHLIQDISFFFFKEDNITTKFLINVLNYKEDTAHIIPVIRGVKERAVLNATNSAPVYLLKFSSNELSNNILDYILDRQPAYENLKKALINRFVAFANTQMPIAIDKYYGNTLWDPVTSGETPFLNIYYNQAGPDFKEDMGFDPYNQTVEFWKNRVNYLSPKPIKSTDYSITSTPNAIETICKTDSNCIIIGVIILIIQFALVLYYFKKQCRLLVRRSSTRFYTRFFQSGTSETLPARIVYPSPSHNGLWPLEDKKNLRRNST